MELYSTNSPHSFVTLKEAVFKGLPDDNGLFMPKHIPQLPNSFFERLPSMSIRELAVEVCDALFSGEIEKNDLEEIIHSAIDFDSPLVKLDHSMHVLELWHGPSLAFKDFGARFMAGLMSYFLRKEGEQLNILVATSGDTGSAVAQGFYNMPGINIVILYPSGKVSKIQEQQLTTLGGNVTALEVDGDFDDCQSLVKKAFLDSKLNATYNLTSANSINIARLIPQSFYYFSAWAQAQQYGKKVVFCTPSGNFGNLCGGILAQKMGLPVEKFVATTNINNTVPQFLSGEEYDWNRHSQSTISNAMDVGSPSNFVRLREFYSKKEANESEEIIRNKIGKLVVGKSYTDEQTKEAMLEVYEKFNYVMCPHTAVAYLGLQSYLQETEGDVSGILLSTAHPSKFSDIVNPVIQTEVVIPDRLKEIVEKEKISIQMGANFSDFVFQLKSILG